MTKRHVIQLTDDQRADLEGRFCGRLTLRERNRVQVLLRTDAGDTDDEIKGQAISAFVTLESGHQPSDKLKEELRQWVAKEIGAMAKPDDIRFTDQLPKTRSGKIMRRLLRELATSGDVKGDTTTLEDLAVISKLKESEE